MTVRVLLVDDHTLVRQAVAQMLDMHPALSIAGQAGSVAEGRQLLQRPSRAPEFAAALYRRCAFRGRISSNRKGASWSASVDPDGPSWLWRPQHAPAAF